MTGRSMLSPTPTINNPNKASRRLPSTDLAKCGADRGTGNAARREDKPAPPQDRTALGMNGQAKRCIQADGDSGSADGDVRRSDADDIDQERHGQDGSATADQRQDGTDQAAREHGEQSGRGGQCHRSCSSFGNANRQVRADADTGASRFQGRKASSLAMPHQPETPAKTRPAPTNADNHRKPGETSWLRTRPISTSEPAAI